MQSHTKGEPIDDEEYQAIAVAEMGGEVRSLGIVTHEIGAIRRVLSKLGKKEVLRVCSKQVRRVLRCSGS